MNNLAVFAIVVAVALDILVLATLNRNSRAVWIILHMLGVLVVNVIDNIDKIAGKLGEITALLGGIIVAVLVYLLIRYVIYYFAWEKTLFEEDPPSGDDYLY